MHASTEVQKFIFPLASARPGSTRRGLARLGSARLGSARLGSAWLGLARLGLAGLSSALPPKVVVSRRRDGSLSEKVASRVDEMRLDFGDVGFA